MSNTTNTTQEDTMNVTITPATVVNISYADNRWLGGRVVALVWVGCQVVAKSEVTGEDIDHAGTFDRHVTTHDAWCAVIGCPTN